MNQNDRQGGLAQNGANIEESSALQIDNYSSFSEEGGGGGLFGNDGFEEDSVDSIN